MQSLQETTLYGMKGVSAYAHHARTLGQSDSAIDEYLFRTLVALSDPTLGLDEWVGLTLECGKVNLRTMEILDAANTGAYGQPEPTKVTLGQRPGKAILVSGHDLADLKALLEQTQGAAWMSTPTARCCRRTPIPSSRSTTTSWATTARPGRTSARSSPSSPARCS